MMYMNKLPSLISTSGNIMGTVSMILLIPPKYNKLHHSHSVPKKKQKKLVFDIRTIEAIKLSHPRSNNKKFTEAIKKTNYGLINRTT